MVRLEETGYQGLATTPFFVELLGFPNKNNPLFLLTRFFIVSIVYTFEYSESADMRIITKGESLKNHSEGGGDQRVIKEKAISHKKQ